MNQSFFNPQVANGAKAIHTLPESMLLSSPLSIREEFQDEVMPPSYAIIGKKKSSNSCRDMRLRRKKTFVQKIFLELVNRFSEQSLQALLYLDFYQELCDGVGPCLQGGALQAYPACRPASPYFVSDQKNFKEAKIRHATLKERFLKMANKRAIAFRPKDNFQLACTLQSLWEHAVRMVEHQSHFGSTLYTIAEAVMKKSKELPQSLSPFEEKKSLVHISSFKLPKNDARKAVKAKENPRTKDFIETVLHFGYEYFGLAQP